jgi:pyruvate dehydrogenase (quinone)
MIMAELLTMVRYGLPVKVVVFKNNVLGQIKWEQIVLEGKPQFGVELQPFDFQAYAAACGAAGFTAERPQDTAEVLRQAFAHPGPAVVQAVVDPHEPPLPGNITVKQMLGFSEAMLRGQREGLEIMKTVIENEVREII